MPSMLHRAASFALLAVALLVFIPSTTEGYEDRAGACYQGFASVGDTHFEGTIKTGPLSFGGLVVSLDGKTLSSDPANFTIGQSHTLTVKSTSSSYKGILFRLGSTGGVDTTKSLAVRSGDSSLRLASDVCTPVGAGGVSHAEDDGKKSSTAVLRLDKVASDLPLDITVVIKNDDGFSTFYYSGFLLNAVAGPPTSPVKSPVKAPSRPTRRPTRRPNRPSRPTRRPSVAPVRRPSGEEDDEGDD